MASRKSAIKTEGRSTDLTDKLNKMAERSAKKVGLKGKATVNMEKVASKKSTTDNSRKTLKTKVSDDINHSAFDSLFEKWDEFDFPPEDYIVDVPVDSLESSIGYGSLMRQMHQAFLRRVAFHKTPAGGSLSSEEARKAAFHACTSKDEAKKIFQEMMGLPLESLRFVDLMELQSFAPRVAEWFWERAKIEGRKEFESGHLAANITFPEGYMKQVWNIARYIGVRESFIDEWNPQGGIDVAMIDMLAQTYFQWQYWLEQTVKRSQTRPYEEHPDYLRWKADRKSENERNGYKEGYWFQPRLSDEEAIEHAVQMADRFHRMFMRTLRQLRDLRRYTQVTINNAGQVNIAAEGGKQLNTSK